MCEDHCRSHRHHHETIAEAAASMPAGEKLIIRLEHCLNHNREHADLYKNLADAARGLGAEKAALLIAAAAEDIQRQNQHLEEALAILKL